MDSLAFSILALLLDIVLSKGLGPDTRSFVVVYSGGISGIVRMGNKASRVQTNSVSYLLFSLKSKLEMTMINNMKPFCLFLLLLSSKVSVVSANNRGIHGNGVRNGQGNAKKKKDDGSTLDDLPIGLVN